MPTCKHGLDNFNCSICTTHCNHRRNKYACIICKPHLGCEHGQYRQLCSVCNPSIFCYHTIKGGKMRKAKCVICNPKIACKHNMSRYTCNICRTDKRKQSHITGDLVKNNKRPFTSVNTNDDASIDRIIEVKNANDNHLRPVSNSLTISYFKDHIMQRPLPIKKRKII